MYNLSKTGANIFLLYLVIIPIHTCSVCYNLFKGSKGVGRNYSRQALHTFCIEEHAFISNFPLIQCSPIYFWLSYMFRRNLCKHPSFASLKFHNRVDCTILIFQKTIAENNTGWNFSNNIIAVDKSNLWFPFNVHVLLGGSQPKRRFTDYIYY